MIIAKSKLNKSDFLTVLKGVINIKLGEININSYGTPMKIIDYRNRNDIDIQFLDENKYIVKHNTYSNFKSGTVRNPYDKTILGIGYAGVGEYNLSEKDKISGKTVPTRAYAAWTQMIVRCYSEHDKNKYPAYYGIATVCDEWHCFQNFAKWYFDNRYDVQGRLHVDKDILYKGNKEYSPQKCLLVPQRINMLFLNKSRKGQSADLPTGINRIKSKTQEKFTANYNGEFLGAFLTIDEAQKIYYKAKRQHIQEIANDYKNIIPEKVYKALIEW